MVKHASWATSFRWRSSVAPIASCWIRELLARSEGPKDAQVTIVEFGDFAVSACKTAQPAIEGLVKAEPNTRFVFQSYPLEMHNWAGSAAYGDVWARVD